MSRRKRVVIGPNNNLIQTNMDKLVGHTLPFKSLGSLRNVFFFFPDFYFFCQLKQHQIEQKYSVDIVSIVNDYCSLKQLVCYGIST